MSRHSIMLLVASTVFFFIIAGIGILTYRWVGDTEDYLVAGREINWYVTGLGIAALAWSGGFFALFSLFAIKFGFFAAFVPIVATGVGYWAYGRYFVPFVRSIGSQSIGEFFEIRYNLNTRVLVSLYLGIAMMIFLPASSLGVANILAGFAGWPIIPTSTAMIAVIGLIVVSGGLWGVSVTNMIQAAFGYTILCIGLAVLAIQFGGPGWLMSNVPNPAVFSFPGTFGLDLSPNSYFTWVILWGVMVVFGSPYYWLLAQSPRSDKDARRGFQLAALMVFVLAVLLALLPLYAYAQFPNMFVTQGGEVPLEGGIGLVARALPGLLGLLLMVTVIAANISSFTTASMGGIASVARDVYQRMFRPDADQTEMLLPMRVITFTFFVGAFLLQFVRNIQILLGAVLTILSISTMILLVGLYVKRVTPAAAMTAAVLGGIVAFAWPILQPYPSIHQIWPTMLVVLGSLGLVSVLTEPKYYGKSSWTPGEPSRLAADGGSGMADQQYELSEDGRDVLMYVAVGSVRYGDLNQALDVDGIRTNEIVEKLEKNGIIQRKKYTGSGLFQLELTDLGEQLLSKNEPDEFIEDEEITETALSVLEQLKTNGEGMKIEEIADSLDMESVEIAPHIRILERRKLISKSGVLRAYYRLSPEGEQFTEP